jgi:hypothetical protein
MIPLKDREQTTTTKAFEKILDNMGIPNTIYSDKGITLPQYPWYMTSANSAVLSFH